MIKDITMIVLVVVAVLGGALYNATQISDLKTLSLGATPGTDHYQAETFRNTLTAYCTKIQVYGATTVASTTYYLVASTTSGGASVAGGFPVFVTSTKPTPCP